MSAGMAVLPGLRFACALKYAKELPVTAGKPRLGVVRKGGRLLSDPFWASCARFAGTGGKT